MFQSFHERKETVNSKRTEKKAHIFLQSLKALLLPIAQVDWEFAQLSMQQASYPEKNHLFDESSVSNPVVDKANVMPYHV